VSSDPSDPGTPVARLPRSVATRSGLTNSPYKLTTAIAVGNAVMTNQNAAPDAARPTRSADCSRNTFAATRATAERRP
jgi:hypothetical protein